MSFKSMFTMISLLSTRFYLLKVAPPVNSAAGRQPSLYYMAFAVHFNPNHNNL
jgi:hypothetical protein